jgi:hypothetical protein
MPSSPLPEEQIAAIDEIFAPGTKQIPPALPSR